MKKWLHTWHINPDNPRRQLEIEKAEQILQKEKIKKAEQAEKPKQEEKINREEKSPVKLPSCQLIWLIF